jgi:hypothetical protein
MAKPAPEETPRMNGLASSFRVTAWKTAPDSARFRPTNAATSTRGIRMLQTTSVGFESSYSVAMPSDAASPSPSRSVASTFGSVQTTGSNTAPHAVASDIENVPKLTCTSAARRATANEAAQNPTSVASNQSNRPARRLAASASAAIGHHPSVHAGV